jgi:hypothetical protein
MLRSAGQVHGVLEGVNERFNQCVIGGSGSVVTTNHAAV